MRWIEVKSYVSVSMNIPDVIVIENVQDPWFPLLSAKVKMTPVVPTGNKLPDAWVTSKRLALPELSVAVAKANVTCLEGVPNGTVWLISEGQVTTGGMLSTVNRKHLQGCGCYQSCYSMY